MWDNDLLQKKLSHIADLRGSSLFRYTVLDFEFVNMEVIEDYDMEEIMES